MYKHLWEFQRERERERKRVLSVCCVILSILQHVLLVTLVLWNFANIFWVSKMNNTFFYVFVSLIGVIYAQNEPDYIFLCNQYYDYETECKHYQFDDKTCFPWNLFNCSITKVDFNEFCLKYDCTVKSFIWLKLIEIFLEKRFLWSFWY
jgi:hypothetical protein